MGKVFWVCKKSWFPIAPSHFGVFVMRQLWTDGNTEPSRSHALYSPVSFHYFFLRLFLPRTHVQTFSVRPLSAGRCISGVQRQSPPRPFGHTPPAVGTAAESLQVGKSKSVISPETPFDYGKRLQTRPGFQPGLCNPAGEESSPCPEGIQLGGDKRERKCWKNLAGMLLSHRAAPGPSVLCFLWGLCSGSCLGGAKHLMSPRVCG